MLDENFLISKNGISYIKADFFRRTALGVHYTRLGATSHLSTINYRDHTAHDDICKPVVIKEGFATHTVFKAKDVKKFFASIKEKFILGACGSKGHTAYQNRVNEILWDLRMM